MLKNINLNLLWMSRKSSFELVMDVFSIWKFRHSTREARFSDIWSNSPEPTLKNKNLNLLQMSDRSENSSIQLAMVDLVISVTILDQPNARTSKKKLSTTTTTPQVATS